MRFGAVAIADAAGGILAHSLKLPSGTLRKGTRLDEERITLLRAAGIGQVTVARLDPADVPEDEAAAAIAAALAGSGVTPNAPRTGRCNLFAAGSGVLRLDAARLDAVNCIDEAITVATLAPDLMVRDRQMLATIKIIPYAVDGEHLRASLEVAGHAPGGALQVAPFRPTRVALVQTFYREDARHQLDKTRAVLDRRLLGLNSELVTERRCAHDIDAVLASIHEVMAAQPGMLVLSGYSAVSDRNDVIPAALCRAGGHIVHFGMPVEPGNLLLLGELDEIPAIAMPGCARNLKFNGFDTVLQRLIAGIAVGPRDIMQMGVGGLLR